MNGKASHISVVIPVRNRPDVIHRAIDSVVAQTYPIHEIIVVDDGSTDNTPQEVERRLGEVNGLRLLRLPQSGGAPRARNAGVAQSSGDYIALLDSDDAWMPTKIAKQVALLDAHPDSPGVFCGISYCRPDGKAELVFPPEHVPLSALQRRNSGGCSLALLRRGAFDQVGGFRPDMPSCQDWDLWLRLAEIGDLYSHPEALVEYHFDGGGRITRNIDNVLKGHQIVFEGIYDRVHEPAARRKLRAEHHKRLSEIFSRHHFRPFLAFSHVLSALALDPTPRRVFDLPKLAARLATYPLG